MTSPTTPALDLDERTKTDAPADLIAAMQVAVALRYRDETPEAGEFLAGLATLYYKLNSDTLRQSAGMKDAVIGELIEAAAVFAAEGVGFGSDVVRLRAAITKAKTHA